MPREINQTKTETARSHLYMGSKEVKYIEAESRTVVARGGGWWKWGETGPGVTGWQSCRGAGPGG